MKNAICFIILMGTRQHNRIHLAWDLELVILSSNMRTTMKPIFISIEIMRMSLMSLVFLIVLGKCTTCL